MSFIIIYLTKLRQMLEQCAKKALPLWSYTVEHFNTKTFTTSSVATEHPGPAAVK